MSDQLFAGHLLHLNLSQQILPEQTKLSLVDMKEIATGRIATQMGEFLTKHFLKIEGREDGSIVLSVGCTILVSEVPKGLAHTTIVFKEVPKP